MQLEEQSRQATDNAKATGTAKKQVAPPDLLEEAFELNMQLEEMRLAQGAGERDKAAEHDLEAARERFTQMLNGLGGDLAALWVRWDAAEDAGDEQAKLGVRNAMVALLNRRSYIRNLVRDVNAALE